MTEPTPYSRTRQLLIMVAAAGLVITTLLTVSDIVMRYVFNRPIFGASEVAQVLLSIIVFAGFWLVALDRSHIRVTLFESVLAKKFPRAWSAGYDLFVIVGCAAVAGILIWRLADLFNFPEDTLVLKIPMTAIVSLLVLLALGALVGAILAARRVRRFSAATAAPGEAD